MKPKIILTFIVSTLLIFPACTVKRVTMEELRQKNPGNFSEVFDHGVCQDIHFLGKKIETSKGIYWLDSCKKTKSGGYVIKWLGHDIKQLFPSLVQDYCKSINGVFFDSSSEPSLKRLRGTYLFDAYKHKEKQVRRIKMPRYYKELLKERLQYELREEIRSFAKRQHVCCCFAQSENFCLSYEYQHAGYKCCYLVHVRELKKKDFQKIAERAFIKAKEYVKSRIRADKREFFWYGRYGYSGKKDVVPIRVRITPGSFLSPGYNINLTLLNRSNSPGTFALRDLNIMKNGKEYPIIFEVDIETKKVLNVYVSGQCEKLIGNKVIIAPGSKCVLNYSRVRIIGISDLNGAIFFAGGIPAKLRRMTRYEENVRSGRIK